MHQAKLSTFMKAYNIYRVRWGGGSENKLSRVRTVKMRTKKIAVKTRGQE